MIVAWVGAQVAADLIAALVAGPGVIRGAVTALLLGGSATAPWFGPAEFPVRALLTLHPLVCMKIVQIAGTPGPWPAWRRLWHLSVPFDVRRTERVKPTLEWRLLGTVILMSIIAGAAWWALANLTGASGFSPAAARTVCAAVLIYALAEAIAEMVRVSHRLVGIDVPPIQRAPVRSSSVGEFWSERWNRPMSEWLSRFVFRPLARRHHATLALFTAFGVTAVVHVWMVAAVGLGVKAAVMMGVFFLVQGAAVLAETRLGTRTWPRLAAHSWTLALLLGPSPLFLSSVLRVLRL